MSDQEPYQYNENTPPNQDIQFDDGPRDILQDLKNENSLDNNVDARSDKNDDLGSMDIFREDFEKDRRNQLSEINLLDEGPQEPKREEQLLIEAEAALSERGSKAEAVLQEIARRFEDLTNQKMVRLVGMVMAVKSYSMLETEFFARAIIFLRELWTRLGKIENVVPYNILLSEILKSSHPFYSINLSEDDISVLQLYLADANEVIQVEDEGNLFANLNPNNFSFNAELVATLETTLGQYFNSVQPSTAPIQSNPHLYSFIYHKFFQNSYRKNISQLVSNVTLLVRAPDLETRHALMDANPEGLFIEDLSILQKRQIEEYTICICEIAVDEPSHAQKYLFRLVDWFLSENQQMEKRISGFKVLGELAAVARAKPKFADSLAKWITNQKILERFLRQSTHARILQQLPPILHFLYEHGILQSAYIVQIMKLSLHSQDLFRIVQGMLSWLRVEHLEEAYDMLFRLKDRQKQPMLSQFLNALVSSPTLQGNNRKRKNIMIQDNRRDMQGEMEIEADELSEKAEFLVKRLMKMLIEKSMIDQQLFMPILLRHINSHMKLLKPQLQKQIITLLRGNSPTAVWILEQCLKAQTSHNQGQGKYELIGRLSGQSAYELTLALIARHRYNKVVVDKCLTVIILFCRYHKPLERGATEFLWKVLGLAATDEREREQFFVFLKDIVRFEGAVSEESVNFIFFELLMGLCADWFSLRVYDCLEMLFLRLNEDCKLISFEKDHYNVIQHPLIGTDKLWYIYFNCPDLKVIKKCKDFIFKLIMNSSEKKQLLYQDSLTNIKKYLEAALQLPKELENKQQVLILRGFQISEKLLLQKQRTEEATKYNVINIKVSDTTPGSFQKSKQFEINEKLTLSDLKLFIAENLNPPRRSAEIHLINKGKILVGQNQTLKEMKLENNETIVVSQVDIEIQPLSKAQKDQLRQQHEKQLFDLFGESFKVDFIAFIVQKLEGETIENMANVMFDQDRIALIKEEYDRSKEEMEEICIERIQKKEQPKKFGEILVETISNIQLLLRCLMVSHNKKGGWKFLKELPINKDYFKLVQAHIQTGDWMNLFKNKTQEESKYIAYILTHIIRQSPTQSEIIFNDKQLRNFLIRWIMEAVDTSMENLEDYENIFKLLLTSLTCPLFSQVQAFVSGKKDANDDKSLSKKLSNMMDIQQMYPVHISSEICNKLIDALAMNNLSEKMATTVVKLYVYQLYYFDHQEAAYSILFHPKLHILLLRYGKPIYFTIIATALRLQTRNNNVISFNISKFTLNLLHTLMNNIEFKQQHYHYAAYFSCLEELLLMTSVQDPNEELKTLLAVLNQLKCTIKTLLQEQIIGYMKISLNLLKRHLKLQHGERKNDQLSEFSQWLFNHYLFGIHESLPFFKSKPVRKISYQLIIGLCSYHQINKSIISSVKKLTNSCKGLEMEQGDFRTTQFIGMKNLGATCYINSLIQQLYHTVFPKMLLEDDTNTNNNNDRIKLLEFKKLFVNLYIGAKSPVSTLRYVETVKINGEQIRPLVQQDVNEYFTSLMHEIEQEAGNQAINSVMGGTYCHEIRGLQEGSQVKNVEETYLTLMIEMKGKKNLNEALSALSKQHILEGDNMYYSEFLHKKIRASSKSYLDKLPPLLVITLKRFYWNFESMTRHKINDCFEFPMELQLSKYSIPGKKEPDHYYQYKLCGIIIHSGSAQSGHYYSYIKVGQKWLQFNDRRVSEWDIQNNMKNQCFGGNQERNRNAYMLFYEKIDSQVHGACLNQLATSNKLIKLVNNENETFIKNRLIYDSGYIDFIKELASKEGNYHLLDVLDDLKISRSSYEPQLSSQIDVQTFLGGKSEKENANSKEQPDLNKKVNEIDDFLKNRSENQIDQNDETLRLLMPKEKGTQNDKL